jgi:hypothetical protein
VTEWKTWPGFSRYEASHRGLIRNRAGKIMAATPDKDGYLRLTLTGDDGEKHRPHVHRAVLLAHAGPPEDGQETCHGPGGRQDNRYPENLRWGTKSENTLDQVAADHRARPSAREAAGPVVQENHRCPPGAVRESAVRRRRCWPRSPPARWADAHGYTAGTGVSGSRWTAAARSPSVRP